MVAETRNPGAGLMRISTSRTVAGADVDVDFVQPDDRLAPERLAVQTMAGAEVNLDQQDDGVP